MSERIKNRDSKVDIRIKQHHTSHEAAQAELRRNGYARRMEMNDLPIMFERKGFPALTIWSADHGKTWQIGEYPTDAEIFKMMKDNNIIENPEKMADRWDKGSLAPDGTLIDLDDPRLKGKK